MRHVWLRTTAIVFAVALTLSASADESAAPAYACAPAYDADVLAAGDVVFIAVDSALWAQVASATSTPERRFGHVGVAAYDRDGALRIVHASGSPTSDGGVVAEAPAQFWREADRVAIYRPQRAALAQATAGAAMRFAELHVPFDQNFSLDSADALYCTELVWRALSRALGGDALPEKRRVAGRAAVTLAMLETYPLLREVRFWRTRACADDAAPDAV